MLLNVSDLATFDQADGDRDGIISNVRVNGTNSWEIDGLTEVSLCNSSDKSESTYVIGVLDLRYFARIYLFTLGTLEKIAESSADENVIDLPEAAASGDFDIWTINQQSGVRTDEIDVACAGDQDADQMEDIVVSFRTITFAPDFSEVYRRFTAIVMMSSDLAALDPLDNRIDKQVSFSRLWRDPRNPFTLLQQ